MRAGSTARTRRRPRLVRVFDRHVEVGGVDPGDVGAAAGPGRDGQHHHGQQIPLFARLGAIDHDLSFGILVHDAPGHRPLPVRRQRRLELAELRGKLIGSPPGFYHRAMMTVENH